MALIVEMIGPSGVGKSWLALRLFKKIRGDGWLPLEEATGLAQLTTPPAEKSFEPYHIYLLEQQFAWMLERKWPEEDFNRLRPLYQNHIKSDIALVKTGIELKALADEHLFQLFIGGILALAARHRGVFEQILENRAFIFITDSCENVVRRQLLRQASGIYRPNMEGADEAVLAKRFERHAGALEQLSRLITQAGGRLIKLNAGQPDIEATICEYLAEVGAGGPAPGSA